MNKIMWLLKFVSIIVYVIVGVFTKPVIEIEIEIRGQSRFTKNVIEIEFQSQADHDWNFIWNFNLTNQVRLE